MKQQKKKKRKSRYKLRPQALLFLFMVILFIANIHILRTIFLYHGVETPLRISASILLIDIVAIFSVIALKLKKKEKRPKILIFGFIILLYSGVIFFTSTKVKAIYDALSTMKNTNSNNYSTSIVVTKNSSYKSLEDAKKGKIGILEEEGNMVTYELPEKIIEEEKFDEKKVQYYTNYVDLLHDLLDGKIDAAFLPTDYVDLYASDEFDSLEKDTKIIYTKKEEKIKKSLEEPFTVLIMGIDKVGNGFLNENGKEEGFGGDSLLLITFNPKTMNSTILSVPRDTYMPITCWNNRKNKITDVGRNTKSGGESCIIDSLENYFDITIDYYAKINFKGVVDLVNAVGGVDVTVPYSFCEQNSEGKWGKNTIFVEAGEQHLDGEQALAYSRHRKVTSYMVNYCGSKYTQHANYWSDFIRGQHQQEVLKAVLSKVADAGSINDIEKLLDIISENLESDLFDSIPSLYNLGKKILSHSNGKNQILNMQKLYLSGITTRIYNLTNNLLQDNFIPYEESYNAVVNAMKVNLELKKEDPVKKFTFSIHNEYEAEVIGKGNYSQVDLQLVPNFVGRSIEDAKILASNNGLNIEVVSVEGSSGQFIGQVLSQDIPELTDVDALKSKTITLKVVSSIPATPSVEEPDLPEETLPTEDLT